ncbi:hypothetical protein F1C58_04695 [Glaciihabitans sp. INWT7]|uniref:hypothetical protein n=1 Tax=Glaciihabitans sp. INWT7 TaxID=2596912 RepID=UPI001626CC57|nr:hypothetical protein [Glaciihabitans sp. INWT7]QNE46275.1 hypothetical protein F1C58_04695 [Glaciihabitans sp. INWT7]
MTMRDESPLSDEDLFSRLRTLWRQRDPMPAGLVDNVLVALATRDLGVEYAMLTMLESSGSAVGVRGDSDVQLLEFAHGTRSIMLRVSDLRDGRRRVDGWIAPAATLSVRLEQDHDDFNTTASAEGRFDFPDIPAGRTRMWLQPELGQDAAAGARQGLTTDYFTL